MPKGQGRSSGDLFSGTAQPEEELTNELTGAVVLYGLHSPQAQDILRRLNALASGKAQASDEEEERQLTKAKRVKANQDKFIAEAVAIEAQAAQEAGMVGYMAKVLVQATMPHSRPDRNEYTRTNGHLRVSMLAPAHIGLPYGSYPRLLLTWLTTEAVRTQSPTLYLGDSLTDFMDKLGLVPTGGRWGTIPRLKEQANRLFGSFVTAYEDLKEEETHRTRGSNILVAEDWDLWWDPRQAPEEGQGALFSSWVKLSDKFYNQVIDRPVPVDIRAIRALKKSPLALDLYAWTTYRVSYLKRNTEIPWAALQMQFGANYEDSPKGRRNFKLKLIEALRKVQTVYPALRAEEGEKGLILQPSPTHVRKRLISG